MSIRRARQAVEVSSLGKIKLYREDLEAIARLAAEVGDLSITCDAFEATDADDFDQLAEKLHNVEITGSDGSHGVEVTLNRKAATVSLIEPNTHTLGVLGSINRITEESRKRGIRLFRWLNLGSAALGLAGLIAFSEFYRDQKQFQLWQNVILSAALALFIICPWFALRSQRWMKERAVIVNACALIDQPFHAYPGRLDCRDCSGRIFMGIGIIIGLVTGAKTG
jgi:hypothetical protein